MSSNYERLRNCSSRQLEAFIRSIVSKRASEFVDWRAWLASDDPDVVFVGEEALYRSEDGSERECRFLSEERDSSGNAVRHVYFFEDDGDVSVARFPAYQIRKQSEAEWLPAPVVKEEPAVEQTAPLTLPLDEPEDEPVPAAEPVVEPVAEPVAAPVTEPAAEEEPVIDDFDLDSYMDSIILSEVDEAAREIEQKEDVIGGRIYSQEQEEAARALEDKPFTDIQNIDPDEVDEPILFEEPEETEEPFPFDEPEVTDEPEVIDEPEETEEPVMPAVPDSTDFLDYQPQLEEFDQTMEDIENTMQMNLGDVPLDEEDEPIGELLQSLKERSALYDPNDQEDHELPTIAFTAIAEDKLVNNE